MLRFMRENAGSWIIKILLGVVVIVFIFLGLRPDDPKNQNVAAVVNDKVITMEEYKIAYNQILQRYRSQFGDNFNDDLIKMLRLKENTLESLIDRELLLQSARKFGIRVTDEELRDYISNSRYFQENGKFSPGIYNNYIKYTYQRPDLFETAQRNDLVIQKFKGLIENTEPVSEDEVRQWFNREKSEINVSYVLFEPSTQAGIKPSDDEIKNYYDKHKDKYMSEPAAKVTCIQFRPADFRDKITVSDKDVESYYAMNTSKYETPKTVEARHILIKVAEDADQATVEKARSKTQDIHQMAVADGKDFAELAKTYSEDSSKDKGGYLGAFEQGSMVKPFADKAFSMKAGEISEPVRTQFGWHLIKVEKINEAKRRQMAEVKEEIRKKLIDDKAKTLAYEASDGAYNLIVGGADMNQAAKSAGLMAIETAYFTQDAGPSEIEPSVARDFSKVVFAMAPKQTSDILEFNGIYFIAQMTEKKDSAVKPMDEVREAVYADLLKDIKDEQAKKAAEAMIAALKEGRDDLEKAGNLKESGFFTRDSNPANQKLDANVMKSAFELTQAKNVSETPVKGDKGYYVIRLKEIKEPDSTLFETEKNRIQTELTDKKKTQAFTQWLSQLKSRSDIERVMQFNE